MADNHESTMNFKVDISQLKSAMQDAKRSISSANAEFKVATAGMDKWSASSTGVEAKLKQLNTVLPQQKAILAQLNQQYKLVSEEQGANSQEAQKLKTQIDNQRATIKKTETDISKYNDQLARLKAEEQAANQPMAKLNTTINEQKNKLSDLKDAYANAVLQYGKNSKEAKDLSKQIESLSKELNKNEEKLDKATSSADKFDKSIKDAGDDAKKAGDDVHSASGKFGSFGDLLSEVATVGAAAFAAAIAAASAAIVKFASDSIRSGMDFDSAMSQVAATMGTSVDQIENLRDFAQEMGSTTAFSATEAANALNYMALAGYDAETSMQMLPNVLTLAAAGGIDLASASDMVTDAQSALGLSIDETTAMVDQMAFASSQTNTSVAQLGEAFLTLGATGANAAGGTTELATILGILADNGIKGSEGGTHLRNIIMSLTNPTNTAADALDELGISAYDSDGNLSNMIDVLLGLQDVLDGMTQEERDSYIGTIFNRADIASVNALLNTSIDRYCDLEEAIGDAAGSAQAMADTQLDNLAGDVTLFQSALEGAQIAVSDALSPTLRSFVQMGSEGLSAITQGFRENGLSGAMTALRSWLSQALTMIVQQAPTFIRAAMQLLGAIGSAIVDNADVIVDSVLEIAQTILDTFAESINEGSSSDFINLALNIIDKLCNFIMDNIGTIIELGITITEQLVEGILSAIPSLLARLPDIINRVATTLIDNLGVILQAGISILMSVITGILNALPQLISMLPTIIQTIVRVLTDNAPLLVQLGFDCLIQLINGLISALPQLIAMAPDIIMTIITVLVENLPLILQMGADIITELLSGMESYYDMIGDSILELGQIIYDGCGEIVGNMIEVGSNIVSGIWEGISSGYEWITGKISEWVGNVTDFIQSAFGIASPSKLMRDMVGKWLPEGIAVGFEADMPNALKRMKTSVAGAISELKSDVSLSSNGIAGAIVSANGTVTASGYPVGNNVTFNQTINSPKAVDGLTLYRETNSLLFNSSVRLGNA